MPLRNRSRQTGARRQRRLRFENLEERAILSLSQVGVLDERSPNQLGHSAGDEMPIVRQMEYLNRGLVALRTGPSSAYVGWRMLGTDPSEIAFNLYRSAEGEA